MIFSDVPDPRLVTIRRGGTLADADHHLLAVWAADCAEHVLHYFEQTRPGDERPRRAIELGAAAPDGERDAAGRRECQWQRAQLPSQIRELVLDDQRLRNDKCWSVFDC